MTVSPIQPSSSANASATPSCTFPQLPYEIVQRIAAHLPRAGDLHTLIRIDRIENAVSYQMSDLIAKSLFSPNHALPPLEVQIDFYFAARTKNGNEALAQQILNRNPQLLTRENLLVALRYAIRNGLCQRLKVICECPNLELDDFVKALDELEALNREAREDESVSFGLYCKREECARVLLECLKRHPDVEQDPSLMYLGAQDRAAFHGCSEALKRMIEQSQRVYIADIGAAVARGRLEMLEFLHRQDPSELALARKLHTATFYGEMACLQFILERVDFENPQFGLDWKAAIQSASMQGRAECLRMMLQRYPSLTIDSEGIGQHPLDLAVRDNRHACVRCLLEMRGDEIPEWRTRSALQEANQRHHRECAEVLERWLQNRSGCQIQ